MIPLANLFPCKRPPPKNLWVSLGLNHRFALFSQCFRGSVGLSFRGSDFHRACGTKNRMKKTTSRGVDEPLPPSLSHRPSPRVSRGRCDGEGGRGGPLLSSPSGGLPDQTCAAITSISPTDSPEEPPRMGGHRIKRSRLGSTSDTRRLVARSSRDRWGLGTAVGFWEEWEDK